MVDRLTSDGRIVSRVEREKVLATEDNYKELFVGEQVKSLDLPNGYDRISVSRMQIFMKCPYYFRLQYIDKFKVEETGVSMNKGKKLHDMFYYASQCGMVEAIRAFDFYDQYPQECENFIRISKEIAKETGKRIPKYAEVELYDKDMNVLLYVDRMDEVSPGVFDLIDYKTGFVGRVSDYHFQLALYVYFVEKLMGISIRRWGIMFLGGEGTLKYEKVNRSKVNMIPEFIRLYEEQVNECIKQDYFGKKRNHGCMTCKFKMFNLCRGAEGMFAKNMFGLLDIYKKKWGKEEDDL